MIKGFIRKISVLVTSSVLVLTGTSTALVNVNLANKSDKQQITLMDNDAPLDVANHEDITVPEEFADLINSGSPITVTVDPTNGVIQSVVTTPQLP